MVDTKELKKKWKNEWISGEEIKNTENPNERKAVIIGEGEMIERKTKTDKTYVELVLPVELNKEQRYLRIGQFQTKFLDTLNQYLGSDTKKWVGAVLQLSVDLSGNIPNIDGIVAMMPKPQNE